MLRCPTGRVGIFGIGSNVTGIQGDVTNIADLNRLYEIVGRAKGTPVSSPVSNCSSMVAEDRSRREANENEDRDLR
jgi:hypothetical protein